MPSCRRMPGPSRSHLVRWPHGLSKYVTSGDSVDDRISVESHPHRLRCLVTARSVEGELRHLDAFRRFLVQMDGERPRRSGVEQRTCRAGVRVAQHLAWRRSAADSMKMAAWQ